MHLCNLCKVNGSVLLRVLIFIVHLNATYSSTIEVEKFSDLAVNSLIFDGPIPLQLAKPSDWPKAALKPLDAGVSSKNVWRINNANRPTKITFQNNGNLCLLSKVKVQVKYFSQNAALTVFPCKAALSNGTEIPSTGSYCYGSVPSTVEWMWSEHTMNISQLESGIQVEIQPHLISSIRGDSYFIIDKIIIEHDGVDCSSTTTIATSTITTFPTTTEPWETETSTHEVTDASAVPTSTTTEFPECPSSTPTPEPCDCCDRCGTKQQKEVHHHYHNTYNYYYTNPSDHLIEQK